MSKNLIFYFDYLSPYSFLAWERIIKLAKKYQLNLQPEPVVLGAILSNWGSKGPAEIPPKRKYAFKEIMKIAAKQDLKLEFPPEHPFNPLAALRATCLMQDHERYFDFITTLFNLCWQDGKNISDINFIAEILKDFGVENGVEKINNPSIKSLLKEKTEKAISSEVFGVPSMIIDEELFWGNDSLPFIEDFLSGKELVNQQKVDEFLNRPRAIDRKI